MILFLKILFATIFISLLLFLYIWKLCFNYHGSVKLKLSLFKKIYNINPEKWDYWESCGDIKHLHYNYERIKLSFPAFLWFHFNRMSSYFRSHKERDRAKLVSILEDCQRDIDALKKQADREMQSAVNQQKEIFNRMKRI